MQRSSSIALCSQAHTHMLIVRRRIRSFGGTLKASHPVIHVLGLLYEGSRDCASEQSLSPWRCRHAISSTATGCGAFKGERDTQAEPASHAASHVAFSCRRLRHTLFPMLLVGTSFSRSVRREAVAEATGTDCTAGAFRCGAARLSTLEYCLPSSHCICCSW